MTTFTVANVSVLSNHGQRMEQNVAYTLTGEMRKAGNVPYNVDSDIPEFGMSVKSNRFTLASAKAIQANDFDSFWNIYAANVHSDKFCYVSNDFTAYVMNLNEFKSFVYAFCTFAKESSKNGGGMKIRAKHESVKMIEWLNTYAKC